MPRLESYLAYPQWWRRSTILKSSANGLAARREKQAIQMLSINRVPLTRRWKELPIAIRDAKTQSVGPPLRDELEHESVINQQLGNRSASH